jgi:hypothetical protein
MAVMAAVDSERGIVGPFFLERGVRQTNETMTVLVTKYFSLAYDEDMRAGIAVLVLVWVAGCKVTGAFDCTDNEQCRRGGTAGRCEPNGWCSFADGMCVSGWRYDDLAGNQLGGTCVGDADQADASDDDGSPIDAVDADTTPRTLVFREGADGYAGTADSYISSNVPGPHGAETVFIWDVDPDEEHSLVRFDAIIGGAAGQIPPGSTVMSATLTLVIVEPTASIGTMREAAIAWDENTTWATFGAAAGVQPDDVINDLGPAPTSGTAMIDVTASLARWVAAPASNNGWVFSPGGGDGCDVASSEDGNDANRPQLSVTFVRP